MTDEVDPLYEMLLRARPGELTVDVVAELLRRPAWHQAAACRGAGVEVFFPDRGETLEHAREMCDGCRVADACREAGEGEYGVWAGTSGRQRTEERRLVASSGTRPMPADEDQPAA